MVVLGASLVGLVPVLQGCGPVAPTSSAGICGPNSTADDILANVSGWDGKVALITGGDTGLGFSIATALARKNVTVVIANRNQTHGEASASTIKEATGNPRVYASFLDLGSLASARRFAENFTACFSQLNFLINDAGIKSPSINSTDGYELVFQVDYLGHFLITDLLLPLLRKANPARIVNVASGSYEHACELAGWPVGCLSDWKYLPPPLVPVQNVTIHYPSGPFNTTSLSYGVAKFLNIQHAAALAVLEASSGVEAFSLSPGFTLTSLTSDVDPLVKKMLCAGQTHPDPSLPENPCPFSAAEGAAVIAFCLAGSARSGAYYSRVFACGERPVAMNGFAEKMQLELYARSREWAGLAEPLVLQSGATVV